VITTHGSLGLNPDTDDHPYSHRSRVESAQERAKKLASALSLLGASKAEYVGQVKPLKATDDAETKEATGT
jgi:hypothetical protein